MITLDSWYESDGKIKKKKLTGNFCYNDKPVSVEINLPDDADGKHNSVMIPITDLVKILAEV
jgi:hypothetical protein